MSMMNLYTLLALYTILIIVLIFVLLRFTPLSGLMTNGASSSTVAQVESNTKFLDSLKQVTDSRQKYLDDLSKILNDEPFEDSLYQKNRDSVDENYKPDFSKVKEDSILRYKVENSGEQSESNRGSNFEFFYSPVTGRVSRSFNTKKNHFGVDVVTKKDDPIKACLDGTVIMTGWQADEGNIVVLQHANELISVYKHCSMIMKDQGEIVQAGDPIAIVGNTGENTTGPHLHFELWKKGKPLNPQDFISF